MQIHYLEKPCSDYVRAAVQTAADIHREDMPGDILIFLTGALFLDRTHLCVNGHPMQPRARYGKACEPEATYNMVRLASFKII